MESFQGFDLWSFWEDSEFAQRKYVEPPPSKELIEAVEKELGYRLPQAYLALASYQNGGVPVRTAHRVAERTSWAKDHIAITGIYAVGRTRPNSLCGAFGSKFWEREWGYPAIGVYFADCPSAGHDMLCLDYRSCGPVGEPNVVHVDQEREYRVTFVAKDFESFIRGLQDEEAFDAAAV